MKIQNDLRNQLWIELNTEILKLIRQGEHIIIIGGWNSSALEVRTRMEKQGPGNTICNIHGYSNALITYQRSKDCPINSICYSVPIMGDF